MAHGAGKCGEILGKTEGFKMKKRAERDSLSLATPEVGNLAGTSYFIHANAVSSETLSGLDLSEISAISGGRAWRNGSNDKKYPVCLFCRSRRIAQNG
jgi:hypothetical protein